MKLNLESNITVIEDWTGPVFVDEPCNNYYDSMDEMLEEFNEATVYERPSYAHPCAIEKFGRLDASDVIESRCCELYEDAYDHIVDLYGLQKFLDEWCNKQTVKAYFPDMKKVIKIPWEKV